jgi:phenylpropionate dioxygenase-like ring-hydroxylating dioxygenase large terminal subunit
MTGPGPGEFEDDNMYINFWYPVARSDEVSNEAPVRVRILSLDFVAFRDESGAAHVLSDTCIHRGGALGQGKVQGDLVECPYHGWQFGGDGHCRTIPSLGAAQKPPARAKVDSYPTAERYGILFAFLGDLAEGERPPLFEIEEYDEDDWRANDLVVFDVNYYYERSIENGLDPAHNEFVHPKQGAPGMRQDFHSKPVQIDPLTEYGSKFFIPFVRDDGEKGKGLMDEQIEREASELKAGSGHVGPNVLITWLQFTQENKFHQYFFEAPIDENNTRIFFVNMRHFMMEPEHDQAIVTINMEIAQEDIDILVKLNPVRTPHTTTKELLVPADKPVVRFREFLVEWEQRGWRIDLKKLREDRGDVAYAIPCPDRRTAGNWVVDEVPLRK